MKDIRENKNCKKLFDYNYIRDKLIPVYLIDDIKIKTNIIIQMLDTALNKIFKSHKLKEDNLLIFYNDSQIIIPLKIREKNPGSYSIYILKTVTFNENKIVLDQIEKHIEEFGYSYRSFELTDIFSYYTDKDRVIAGFEKIIIN